MTTTHYTDTQLKQALAKMLPDRIFRNTPTGAIQWRIAGTEAYPFASKVVLDTEFLHLCQLARKQNNFTSKLSCDATWQEQIIELI